MAAKIAALVITLIINIAAGIAVFFVMVLAMNGFSGSDADYGFVIYIELAVIVTLLMSAFAAVTVNLLKKREFGTAVSVLLAVIIFAVTGIVLKVVCSIIGVLVADFVRVNY